MLGTLILVAAVANLNLAVANVALPDIGKAFDAGQTQLNLVAVGYSLGLAASVLYFGAVGDRYGRKRLLLLGTLLSIPACLIAGLAGSIEVLFAARVFGGLAAGMSFPTTLALITALWSGKARTQAIALWSGIGGAIAALGPLLSGALLEEFDWGSVFVVTTPLAVVALIMAWRFVPAHVNETTDPVDNLGGIISVVLVGALVLSINFTSVPGKGTLALGLGLIALAATAAFLIRQRRARNPLYDLHVAGRRVFWVAAYGRADRVRLAHGGDVHRPAVPPERARLLDARRGGGDPAGSHRHGDRGAALGEARGERDGARFTLLIGYVFCLLGFLTMLLLWDEGSAYWEVGLGYAFVGARRRPRRHAGLALADRFGAREAGRHGVRDRGPAARPRRRDHAVDPRVGPHRRLHVLVPGPDRRLAAVEADQRVCPVRADQVVRERGRHRRAVSAVREADHVGCAVVLSPGR